MLQLLPLTYFSHVFSHVSSHGALKGPLIVKDCFNFVFFLTFDDVQRWLVLKLLPWEKVGCCSFKDIAVEYWVDPGLW